MSQFLLYCEHTAEECEELGKEYEVYGVPGPVKGQDYYCSCPYGFHAGWVVVEAASAEHAMASLPPLNRAHTKAYQVETMRF
ncbi:MAG TPA: hypothetical protein VI789_09190 [Dehalococcoidia bacterium]|nr:hypothetical protein [Dehalococcoidia bacterium]